MHQNNFILHLLSVFDIFLAIWKREELRITNLGFQFSSNSAQYKKVNSASQAPAGENQILKVNSDWSASNT